MLVRVRDTQPRGFRMNARLVAVVAVFALSPALAGAQQQLDRRSREEPEIVVEAGGRFGACDALRFSADGNFLFAAGDDKVVRAWPHTEKGLETEREKAQVLRWRAWREQRGGIKAIDVSPDAKRVAVGGYGMKPSTVAVLDRASGDTVALTWPETREGDPNFNVVTAVRFHPDGRVGFGTADGSLWIWNPAPLKAPDKLGRTAALPRRVGKHDPLKRATGPAEFNFPRLVDFPNKDTLRSVAQSGQVLECDLANPAPDAPARAPVAKVAFYTHDGQAADSVFRAELIDGGRWFALANDGPRVLLRSTDGKRAIVLPLGEDRYPRSVAWHPKSRQLAVGVARVLPAAAGVRFYSEGADEVWLYDDPITNRDAKPTKLPLKGRAEAIAFHPTETRLAVAGGDADEIVLLDLEKPERALRGVRSGGRRPWTVALSENGKTLGVQTGRAPDSTDPNTRGQGDWTRFDLSRLKPTRDEGQAWVKPLSECDGWKVVPDPDDRFVWHVQRLLGGKAERLRLALDSLRDQAPTCFAFLPAGGAHPTRLLVGHYYGVTLFELLPERAREGALYGSRVFTGHAGEVTSIAVAKGFTWFVTGGTDQTVAAWSLKDWKHEPNFGATFEEFEGAVRVKAVDTGSPGWEAGLRAGDTLDLLAVEGKRVYERRPGMEPLGAAKDALAALKSPRPRVDHHFGVAAREAAPRYETVSSARQRPVWKWFPAFDPQNRLNDWVVWMWHGSYYHTKSANGDRLVGWHVNAPDPGGRPEFYQLQQFEKRFHRPDLLEQLVADGDVGAALATARGPNPVREPFDQFEPAPVRVALRSLEVGNDGLPLTISIRPRGTNPDLLPERVELWLNDYLAETWPRKGKQLDPKQPFEEKLVLEADKFRAGDNRLTVVAYNAVGGRTEEVHLVRNPRAATAARLLGVLAGVNDYSAVRNNPAGARNFGDLKHACDDVSDLGAALKKCAGQKLLYTSAEVDTHLDPKRAKLAAALAEVAKQARPDDTLVVFFAGHGDLLMPKDAALPKPGRGLPTDGGTFLLCCPDYAPGKATETALSAEELFAALARINCKKVVLLDACHSGRLATTNVMRRCVPNGQGPLIIAACDEGEESYEHPKYGHGLFTFAVLSALDKDKDYRKADFDSDGVLSAEEFFGYISGKVPDLLTRAGLKEPQTPVCFPRQLPTAPLFKR